MDTAEEISRKAIALGKLTLRMTTHAGSGHPSSSLSILHIITALMYKVMRFDPQNPWNPSNDRLVLSEGHAVPIVYAAYADLQGGYGSSPQGVQFLSTEDLDSFRQINSPLDGHPNPSAGFPFFDCATGSLGQGLSCACGVALAARLNNIEKKIFVIIGDSESREGQIWEAMDFLVDNNLSSVIPIFNCNGLGQTGPISAQQSINILERKLKSWGLRTIVIDGHDPADVLKSLRKAKASTSPTAILAKTVKGWGVSELQSDKSHGKALPENKLGEAIRELDSSADLQTIPPDHNHRMYPQLPQKVTLPHRKKGKLPDPDFNKLLHNDPYIERFKRGLMSTRRAFGIALRELATVDERIVALDADVNNSTFSRYMAEKFPERFFQCGIAEQNMLSVASGLSSGGFIPFVSSFAKFLVRAYDQLELALISGANLKICGSHSGANIAADGPSQMGLSDMGYMRALSTSLNVNDEPLMVIFNPACAVAAFKCVQLMVDRDGACYMRTIRQDTPLLYSPDETFEIGGAKTLIRGNDVAVMASGYMVHTCKGVVEELRSAGVDASLYDCYSIPIKPEIVIEAARENKGKIITVEDNFGNGLGAEVSSIVSADPSASAVVKQIFVKRMPKSGITAEDVLDFVGMGI